MEEFGIEEYGPVPNLEENGSVPIPESLIQLSEAEEVTIQEEIAEGPPDDNGIMAYLVALTAVRRIVH